MKCFNELRVVEKKAPPNGLELPSVCDGFSVIISSNVERDGVAGILSGGEESKR